MADTNLSSFIGSIAELVFEPPRPLEEIDAELKVVTDRIVGMIGELSK